MIRTTKPKWPNPDFELEKREAERMAKERGYEENPDDYYRDAETAERLEGGSYLN